MKTSKIKPPSRTSLSLAGSILGKASQEKRKGGRPPSWHEVVELADREEDAPAGQNRVRKSEQDQSKG